MIDLLTLDLSHDLVNVALVVVETVVGDRKFTVGGQCSTITVGQVVDDDLDELLGSSGCLFGTCRREVVAQGRNLGNDIEPSEVGHRGYFGGLGLEGRVADSAYSCRDLILVVRAKESLKWGMSHTIHKHSGTSFTHLVSNERISGSRSS